MWVLEPEVEPRLHRSRAAPVSCSSARMRTRGRSTSSPAVSLADRLADPAERAVGGEHELRVGRLRQPRGARLDLAGERLLRRGARAPWRPDPPAVGVGREAEAVEPADRVAFDDDFAGLGDFGFQHRVLSQPPHQHAGAAVDEAFGQPLVQRVGQLVLDARG